MKFRIFLLLFFLAFLSSFAAKEITVSGVVTDEKGQPVTGVFIVVYNKTLQATDKTFSDNSGKFSLQINSDSTVTIIFTHIGFKTLTIQWNPSSGERFPEIIKLTSEIKQLKEVVVEGKKQKEDRNQVSSLKIDPKLPKYLPSAFGDFNKILSTVGMGVTANSELTSQYGVRGGNFEENLVYVNGMEVYRPFLVRAGQQEGLSFINPDMVDDIEFSAGGWQPRYGDKLSSVLAIKYREPRKLKASATVSLLGGALHIENASKNKRVSYIIGARQKSSQYLLNTLPVQGEYRPRFYDLQSYITLDLTRRKDSADFEKRTTVGILNSYARNRYFVQPRKSEVNFGTFDNVMKLSVAFVGQEYLEYETWQSGINLTHKFSDKLKSESIISGLRTVESERFDIEAGYKLCEVETDPNSSQFNQCIFVRGAGTEFNHGRNRLEADIYSFTQRLYYNPNNYHHVEAGFTQSHENIGDRLYEYSFIDSARYITFGRFAQSSVKLNSWRSQAYIQDTYIPDSSHVLTCGIRMNYWSLNNQLLFSPRLQYTWIPDWKTDIVFRAAAGVYQQPPFYRELRNNEGEVNTNLKAQTSYHVIAGSDLNFNAWNRPFKFIAEAYYKYITNVVPYDMDNVRLRYYAHNNARAYAAGLDLRVSGEFVRGEQSWFSLSFLNTREDVAGDSVGFIRRPTDQRITAGIFFQDHIPNNPSIKMYLNLVFGSGLPFGPPGNQKYRSVFSGPPYRRVDIGFSKLLTMQDKELLKKRTFESFWISFEVLNLLGTNNTISYYWVSDYNGAQYAVPNTLSARFLNIRLIGKF
ncbi:MAG: carboxypeptidase-like regulatory domain-containing protein [Cytophagaceae bacterium]